MYKNITTTKRNLKIGQCMILNSERVTDAKITICKVQGAAFAYKYEDLNNYRDGVQSLVWMDWGLASNFSGGINGFSIRDDFAGAFTYNNEEVTP